MTEAQIQRECNEYLRKRCILFLHLEAGRGARGKTHRASWPDLLIWHKGYCFGFELKVEGKSPTEEQRSMFFALAHAGVTCGWGTSLDMLIDFLKIQGVVK
jgi:hypothetical protein